jgi:asparagine synthase (glutamine-hydrolysing)
VSGIFGVWHRDGEPVDRDVMQRASERLAHRGTDGHGVWQDGSVALGARLMFTTPESLREVQPIVRPESRLVLCADARIDNRDELLPLVAAGRRPDEISDPELILCAYETWGAGCVARLLGDFAFAVWDRRQQAILLARDPMGVRPLYYHVGEKSLAFATEIKGLLAFPEVPRRLNESMVVRFLEEIVDERELTMYESILRLPAAHWIRIGTQRVTRERYWRLDVGHELRLGTDGEYAEALRDVFSKAVSCRVRSAFPVGSTLTGGLDSSSIACVARDVLATRRATPLDTFSAVFPGLPEPERRVADESRFIDAVVATGGLTSHRVAADELDPWLDFDRVLWHLDEAPLAYNLYLHWALFGAARQAGVRVFLDGLDGDACVGYGREKLTELARGGHWAAFEAEIRALCDVFQDSADASAMAQQYAIPVIDALAREGEWRRWATAMRELWRRFGMGRRQLAVDHGLRPLVLGIRDRVRRSSGRAPPPLLASVAMAARVGYDRFAPRAASPMPSSAAEAHRAGLEQPAYQLALEIGNKAAAAFGMEMRFPFFDRRLMQFCVSLPVDQKLSNGWPRAVFRRAMEGILPSAVQWRAQKQDLSPAFRRGLRRSAEALLQTFTSNSKSVSVPVVDRTLLDKLYTRFTLDADSRTERSDGHALYRASSLLRWLAGDGWDVPSRPR